MRKSFVIGIAGGSGSGKTWLARFLDKKLKGRSALISQDWYYKDNGGSFDASNLNFDHPRAIDTPLLIKQLDALRRGERIDSPRYDYETHTRLSDRVSLASAQFIIMEGIFVLHDKQILRRLDLSVYVDLPADVRLLRRIRRDISERGLPLEETLRLYEKFVRPMHDRFVEPSSLRANRVWRPLRERHFPARLAKRIHSLAP
jgi:uridine kinase